MNPIIVTSVIAAPAAERARVLPQDVFEHAKAAWKLASDRKELTSDSLAAWALLRGADPKKGFCAIANPVKLANGAAPWGAYEGAMRSCQRLTRSALAPWEKMLTEQGCVFKGYQWSGSHPLLLALAAAKPA